VEKNRTTAGQKKDRKTRKDKKAERLSSPYGVMGEKML